MQASIFAETFNKDRTEITYHVTRQGLFYKVILTIGEKKEVDFFTRVIELRAIHLHPLRDIALLAKNFVPKIQKL